MANDTKQTDKRQYRPSTRGDTEHPGLFPWNGDWNRNRHKPVS